MPTPEVIVCPDAGRLAERAAGLIADAAAEAVRARGVFTLALAGGATPAATYAALAARRPELDWQAARVFTGDERMVPHADPRSNVGMACRSLFDLHPVPLGRVFPVRTDLPPPAAAADYAATLATVFGVPPDGPPPAFDLILLGLGEDGHTASLFPASAALAERRAWVTWSPPGGLPPPVPRVTFTLGTINAARRVMFLVSGEAKAEIVRTVRTSDADVWTVPAVGVRPSTGTLTWVLDAPAARLLPTSPGE